MSEKFGSKAYDLNAYLARGAHELSNGVIFPDSHIPLRDHSGLYGAREDRGVEPAQRQMEHGEPDLER